MARVSGGIEDDPPAVGSNDLECRCKPDASPFALGGEVWRENAFVHVRWDSWAGI